MMVAFGENGIKTLEDLADCATDDLVGWTERKKEKDAEPVRHKGVLEGFEIGRKEAEDMIMSARVLAGWIKAEDLLPTERSRPRRQREGERRAGRAAAKTPPPKVSRRCAGTSRKIGLGAEERQQERDDDGEAAGSLRRCIVTRVRAPPDDLLRFVADPDGTHRSRSCAQAAWSRRVGDGRQGDASPPRSEASAFAKSLKRQVTVAAGLAADGRSTICKACARSAVARQQGRSRYDRLRKGREAPRAAGAPRHFCMAPMRPPMVRRKLDRKFAADSTG